MGTCSSCAHLDGGRIRVGGPESALIAFPPPSPSPPPDPPHHQILLRILSFLSSLAFPAFSADLDCASQASISFSPAPTGARGPSHRIFPTRPVPPSRQNANPSRNDSETVDPPEGRAGRRILVWTTRIASSGPSLSLPPPPPLSLSRGPSHRIYRSPCAPRPEAAASGAVTRRGFPCGAVDYQGASWCLSSTKTLDKRRLSAYRLSRRVFWYPLVLVCNLCCMEHVSQQSSGAVDYQDAPSGIPWCCSLLWHRGCGGWRSRECATFAVTVWNTHHSNQDDLSLLPPL